LTVAMTAAYDLDAKEVSFITGSGADTNKVESIVEDALERRERQTVEHSGSAFFSGSDEGERSQSVGEADGDTETDAGSAEGSPDGAEHTADEMTAGHPETHESQDDDDDEGTDTADDDDGQSGLSDFM